MWDVWVPKSLSLTYHILEFYLPPSLSLSLSYSIGHLFFAHCSVVTVGMGGEGAGARIKRALAHTHTHTHTRARPPEQAGLRSNGLLLHTHTHYKHTHPEEEPKREKIRLLLSSSLFSICLHYYPSLILKKKTLQCFSLSLSYYKTPFGTTSLSFFWRRGGSGRETHLHFSLFLFLGFDFEGINGKTLNRVYDEDDHVENFNQLRERIVFK